MNFKIRLADENNAWNHYFDALINLKIQPDLRNDSRIKAKMILDECKTKN